MLAFLCQEIKSFSSVPGGMSLGPAGLQDCTGDWWWAIMWQTASHSLGIGKELTSTISLLLPWASHDILKGCSYLFWSLLSTSPSLLGQLYRAASRVSGHRTCVNSTYSALGGPQASLYIGPGCDLHWMPSNEERAVRTSSILENPFPSSNTDSWRS